MSELVDSSQHEISGLSRWLRRLGVVLALAGLLALLIWGAMHLSRSRPPAHQVAKIMLLPDQPPPPPPPPPPEKPKIQPKDEMKQEAPKVHQETPPEPQQLKMEGQAGDGPSPFSAGEVKNDYIGGDIGNGERFAIYVGHVAQVIQEELRRRGLKVADARVFLWLTPDGRVSRYELAGVSGDSEKQLRAALANMEHLPEAPPQDMPMPMGLEISGR